LIKVFNSASEQDQKQAQLTTKNKWWRWPKKYNGNITTE